MYGLASKKPIIVVIIFSLAFAVCVFIQGFHLSFSRLSSEYSQMAITGADRINIALEKTELIVQSIAWSNEMRSRDLQGTDRMCERLHFLYPILYTIYVTNQEGKVLLATASKVDSRETIYIGDRPYFKSALEGKSMVSGPYQCRGIHNGELTLIVSSPYYLPNGNFGGVVAAAVTLSNLKKIAGFADNNQRHYTLSLVSPDQGVLFTVGGRLDGTLMDKLMQVIHNGSGHLEQRGGLSLTASLLPLGENTPYWVAVVGWPGTALGLVAKNLVAALLLGLLMAAVYGNIIFWNRQRQRQEKEKREQLAFLGEMAATIAHEIRNPLTFIKGTLSLRAEKGDEDVSLLLEEVEHIETIITDILLVAKPIPPRLESLEITKVVADAIQIMMMDATGAGITIQLITSDYGIMVKADRVQIRHVFINLIKNAIESMNGPGIITARVENDDRYAVVQIEDQGEGMTPQDMSHLGELFYTTKEKGTGLGVSTCFRVVQAHQGRLEVKSQKGEGSTFTVYLPLDGDQATSAF